MHYKTVFCSDLHIGTRSFRSDLLLKFFHENTFDKLYLIGDIIDIISLKDTWYWPQQHNTVIQKILRMDRHGIKVIYVPGNHDWQLRRFCPINIGGIELVLQDVHKLVDGSTMLVIHGDAFDTLVSNKFGKYLTHIGTIAYDNLITINVGLNYIRRKFGLPYWSLANYLKSKVKNAMKYVNNFEEIVCESAKKQGHQHVICGHIHQPAIKNIDGITYYNTGTFQDGSSLIVEHMDGTIELIKEYL